METRQASVLRHLVYSRLTRLLKKKYYNKKKRKDKKQRERREEEEGARIQSKKPIRGLKGIVWGLARAPLESRSSRSGR